MSKVVITLSMKETMFVFKLSLVIKVWLMSEECKRTTGAADEEEEDVINTQTCRKTRNSLKHKHREIFPFI